MLSTSGLLYLIARAVSAAGNLAAVAIFSRLAGPAQYGQYLLIFAWMIIVYGFGAQWMWIAYFGVYRHERFAEYVASLARLLGCGVATVALALAIAGALGLFEPSFLAAVFALVCGIVVYEGAFEVARTTLDARGAALGMILRAFLTIVFGGTALLMHGGAKGLALGIALAHVVAAVPCAATFSGVRFRHATRAASLHIVRYGWPLLLSFGVSAVGQSIDRLLLVHYLGNAALGPYGVVADMLRQSFTVAGDAITLWLITLAKQHANSGEHDAAENVLRKAFNCCLAAACFGAAFFIVFGDALLGAVLKPDFVAPSRELIPMFAVAYAFMTMRNYYFAQVIYFSAVSYIELAVSVLFVALSAGLALALVPSQGARGAAIALTLSWIVSCMVYVGLGRRFYKLPVDYAAAVMMPVLAILFVVVAQVTAGLMPIHAAALGIDGVIFVLLGAFVAHRFGLLRVAAPVAGDGTATRISAAPERSGERISAAAPYPHAEFLGLRFCLLPQGEVVRLLIEDAGAPFRYVITPNCYHVARVHDEPERLLPAYRQAWLSLCDSRILRGLARLEGRSLPLVTGSDLVAALLSALSAADGVRRLLIVGPPHGAAAALSAAYPDLVFDLLPAPAGLAGSAELRRTVARACIERPWDILLLCVGCPAQELIAREIAELGRRGGVALCVGAAIDFLIGSRARAPLWLQKLGLEWAYRLASEPRRLWRRYLVESPKVLRIFVTARGRYARRA